MVGNDVVDLADAESHPDARHARFDERVFAPCERQCIEDAKADGRLRWILWAAKESAYKVAKRRDPATVFSPARFVVELARISHHPSTAGVHLRTLTGDFGARLLDVPMGTPPWGELSEGERVLRRRASISEISRQSTNLHTLATRGGEICGLGAALRGRVRHAGEAFPVQVTLRDDCVHAVASGPGGKPEQAITGVRRLAGEGEDACASERPGREARSFAVAEIAVRLAAPADSLHIARRGRIPRLLHRDGREVGDLSLSHHGRFVAYACALPPARGEVTQ